MKIAIDVSQADGQKTGKGYYTYGLVSQILQQDQVNQYILYSRKPENPFKEQANVTFKFLPKPGLRWHYQVLKDLKIIRPDYFFAPTSFIIPFFAPKWLKTIITVHDLVAYLFPQNHQKKAVLIERLTLPKARKTATHILVVSDNTAQDLQKFLPTDSSKISIIPCAPNDLYRAPISASEIGQVKHKFQLPESFLLAVGTLEPRKNFLNLIKSFVAVKRRFPEYKLVIVGKKGWKFAEIYKLVSEYKLTSDVIFTGYMTDLELHATYHSAAAFVFPSLYEGFGIPPLEAMASGCPVVSSNAASLPEVIGDAGLLIDPKNSVKIADAIISLLDNPQLKNMLMERGFRRSQKFTWQHSAQLFLRLINPEKENEEELTEQV